MTVDLSTRYLGLELRSPIVVSANPLTREPEMVAKFEEAGAGAIVMPSLFEEEIENEEIELAASLDQGTEGFAEALDYFPEVDTFIGEGDRYLRSLETLKRQALVPIIASLNANSVGGWVRFAKLMADAGADALELNLYRINVDRSKTSTEVEDEDLELIAAVRAAGLHVLDEAVAVLDADHGHELPLVRDAADVVRGQCEVDPPRSDLLGEPDDGVELGDGLVVGVGGGAQGLQFGGEMGHGRLSRHVRPDAQQGAQQIADTRDTDHQSDANGHQHADHGRQQRPDVDGPERRHRALEALAPMRGSVHVGRAGFGHGRGRRDRPGVAHRRPIEGP